MKISTFVIRIWRVGSILLAFGLTVFSYTLFSADVGVHFDAQGQADQFMAKSDVFYIVMALFLVNNVLLLTLGKKLLTLPTQLLPVPNRAEWAARREQLNEHLKNWFYCLVAIINTLIALGVFALASVNSNQFQYGIGQFSWLFYLAFGALVLILLALPLRLMVKPTSLPDFV